MGAIRTAGGVPRLPLAGHRGGETQRPSRSQLRMALALASIQVFILAYVLLFLPFIPDDGQGRIENILFWPLAFVVTAVLVWRNRRWIEFRFFHALPIMALAAYMIFAAFSILWAYNPSYAASRIVVHTLLCAVVVLPSALPIRTDFTIPALNVVYGVAFAISAAYVLTVPPSPIGHAGYFTHKQALGLLGASGFIIAAHEMFFKGWRRILGLILCCVGIWLVIASQSKSAFSFALFAMVSAWIILLVCKYARTTPAFVIAFVVLGSFLVNGPIPRIGGWLYGDPTLTGRLAIWAFIEYQISLKTWLGWGFHSYYFVPNSPILSAPGYVSFMPSSHSGYLELKLETGRIGYWIFLVFIFSSLHVLEYVRRADPVRAWCYLSIVVFALLINLLDSVWLVLNPLWILYLIIVAESVRYSIQLRGAEVPRAATRGTRFPVLKRRESSH